MTGASAIPDPAALRALCDQWLAHVQPAIEVLAAYRAQLKAAGLSEEVSHTLVLDAAGTFGLRWTPEIKLPGLPGFGT